MSVVRFDQIARECRETFKGSFEGKPIVGLEHIEPYDMLQKNYDVDVETTFTKSFKKGQILFGRRRAYQHKACVATIDGICSGDITVIEPIEGKVYPDLLPFIIQNDDFFEHAIKGSNGALSPRVKWEHMANFEFNLPSLAEQKVLAEKLWAAYEVKQSYLKMIAATEEMVKAQFVEIFGNIDNPKYETCFLTAISENLDSRRVPIKSGNRVQGPYPYYGASGIVDYVSDFIFDENILLISEDGANLKDRTTPIAFSSSGKVWVNNHAHVLCFNDDYLQKYVEIYFNLNKIDKYLTGTAQPKLNQDKLNCIPIPIPPKMELDKFISIADQSDKSISELRKSVDAIDKVIKSLINENL